MHVILQTVGSSTTNAQTALAAAQAVPFLQENNRVVALGQRENEKCGTGQILKNFPEKCAGRHVSRFFAACVSKGLHWAKTGLYARPPPKKMPYADIGTGRGGKLLPGWPLLEA